MRLTERQAKYVQYLLDRCAKDDYYPAKLDGRTLTFTDHEGYADFLQLVRDEASYDASCGMRTAGFMLAAKLEREY